MNGSPQPGADGEESQEAATPPKSGEQKLPFTDDELKRMYEACPKIRQHLPGTKWTGEDLADFISLSIYTGFGFPTWRCFTSTACARSGEIVIAHDEGRDACYAHGFRNGFRTASRPGPKQHGPLIFGAHTKEPRRDYRFGAGSLIRFGIYAARGR
jgi:hypothetical protein